MAQRRNKKCSLPLLVKEIRANCDYAIVKFGKSREAYRMQMDRDASAWFKIDGVGLFPSQVHVHLQFVGRDEKRKHSRRRTVDVDFYMPIEEFNPITRITRGVIFKADNIQTRHASMTARAPRHPVLKA